MSEKKGLHISGMYRIVVAIIGLVGTLGAVFLADALKAGEETKVFRDFVKDSNGRKYQIANINGQTWLAENLTFNRQGSYCYGNKQENCRKYGYLYTWEAAEQACSCLGPGWRLPTKKDWMDLIRHFNSDADTTTDQKLAYLALRKKGVEYFGIKLGGYYNSEQTFFYYLGQCGFYWSETELDDEKAWILDYDQREGTICFYPSKKINARSLRCVKD